MFSEQAVREALPAAPRLHVAQLKKPFPVRGRPAESLNQTYQHQSRLRINEHQSELSESFNRMQNIAKSIPFIDNFNTSLMVYRQTLDLHKGLMMLDAEARKAERFLIVSPFSS